MKKYFLLAFLVFCFGCGQKKPITEKSNFHKLNFYDLSKSIYQGMQFQKFNDKTLLYNGFELSREALQYGSVCVLYKDSSSNYLAADIVNNTLQRWVINRNGCGSFLLTDMLVGKK